MKLLPLKAQFYIYCLVFCVVVLTISSVLFAVRYLDIGIYSHIPENSIRMAVPYHGLGTNADFLVNLLVFSILICLTDLYPIVLSYNNESEATVSCALKAAVAILYGPQVTTIGTVVGTLFAEILLRRVWYKAAFNVAEMTLASAGMSLVYQLLYGIGRDPFASIQGIGALLAMTLAFFFLNWGLVTTIISLTTGASFWFIWKANLSTLSLNYLTVIPLGAAIAIVWEPNRLSILSLALPLVIIRQSLEYIAALQRQTHEALIKMADAIDQRDPSTFQHSQRVAMAAEAIAKEMDLPAEDVDTIRMAARLHDLGKIGMSNTLLYKPGSFDDRERDEFRRHPALGADLVQSFHLFRQGRDLILHHHERYDGKGYPIGLAGEEIPLGSRILAVADAFDAMISPRVYREPLTWEQAIEELQRNKATQFDPEVVDAFLRVLEQRETKLVCYSATAFEPVLTT